MSTSLSTRSLNVSKLVVAVGVYVHEWAAIRFPYFHGSCPCSLRLIRQPDKPGRLWLDSRVVDLPGAYNPTFVILSSWKPFFFNSLKKGLRFSDNAGA